MTQDDKTHEAKVEAAAANKCDCGATLTLCTSCAVADYQAAQLRAEGRPPSWPPRVEEWMALHIYRHHVITRREQFLECDCGATFWPEAAPLDPPTLMADLLESVRKNDKP